MSHTLNVQENLCFATENSIIDSSLFQTCRYRFPKGGRPLWILSWKMYNIYFETIIEVNWAIRGESLAKHWTVYAAYKLQLLVITLFDWMCHNLCNLIIFDAHIHTSIFLNLYDLQIYCKINLLHITSIILLWYKVGKLCRYFRVKILHDLPFKLEKNVFVVLFISVHSYRGNLWLLWCGSIIQVPISFYLILRG